MSQPIRGQGGHLVFPIGPKNTNLVEDVEILLPVKFRWILFKWFQRRSRKCEKLTTDDGQRVITIVHLSLRLRCTKNQQQKFSWKVLVRESKTDFMLRVSKSYVPFTCKFSMVMQFVPILHKRCRSITNFYIFSYDKTSLKFCESLRFSLQYSWRNSKTVIWTMREEE